MQFLTIATLFAATALAIPGPPFSAQQQDGKCQKGVKKCCTQKVADASQLEQHNHKALLDLLDLEGLTGQNGAGEYTGCENLVDVIGGQCRNDQTYCCTSGNQQGLVNIGCVGVPIQI
ncbi:hypothetical protein FE257_001443 [Aspergillus nanangensis]|uniref:Hydrophobin n=1 Tax=Aspergillus nanangensis TaxID=2582783 RepID=A0AAD4GPN0_ASPNN|nr:hypothetical protein FE257_001443 [Aspergillus nanangensis]